jgi:hypothetical protein
MIYSGDINQAFAKNNMKSVEYNSKIVEYILQMVAFINKTFPLATSPYQWSDYEKLKPSCRLYRMPFDRELLKLSSTAWWPRSPATTTTARRSER